MTVESHLAALATSVAQIDACVGDMELLRAQAVAVAAATSDEKEGERAPSVLGYTASLVRLTVLGSRLHRARDSLVAASDALHVSVAATTPAALIEKIRVLEAELAAAGKAAEEQRSDAKVRVCTSTRFRAAATPRPQPVLRRLTPSTRYACSRHRWACMRSAARGGLCIFRGMGEGENTTFWHDIAKSCTFCSFPLFRFFCREKMV